jgi:hypothetical protein
MAPKYPMQVEKSRSVAAPKMGKNNSVLGSSSTSVGNISDKPDGNGVKTSRIKIRGTGAATKGLYARGPMA